MKFQKRLAELTEAVKELGTRVDQLSGKFDELAEAVKRLVTMIEQPFCKDQIVELVVKVVQEITSSEVSVCCKLVSSELFSFHFSRGFAEFQVCVAETLVESSCRLSY